MAKKVTKKTTAAAKKKAASAQNTARRKAVTKRVDEPQRPAPKEVKTYLNKDELDQFHLLLVEKLEEIIGDVDHIENGALKKSRQEAAGDLSSMPIHMADIGSDNYEQEFSLGLMRNEQKIVQEIILALRRIQEGTYGMCQGTGEPIPKARLEAFPWARYSVQYAERIEQGKALEVSDANAYANNNNRQ